MMKYLVTLILFSLSGSLNAQQKPVIYYDNRNNSIVKALSTAHVPRMLAENVVSGFSTVNFTISKSGAVMSIDNLLKSEDLMFKTAQNAIYKTDGAWKIKPGLQEQTFQVTFFITTDSLVSLTKNDAHKATFRVPVDLFIKYQEAPKEITILPTVTVIYKGAYKQSIFTQ